MTLADYFLALTYILELICLIALAVIVLILVCWAAWTVCNYLYTAYKRMHRPAGTPPPRHVAQKETRT